jgi:hypothetical protein
MEIIHFQWIATLGAYLRACFGWFEEDAQPEGQKEAPPMSKVWFITGTTRGLGTEIAKAALGAGDKVLATGRDAQAVIQAVGH